MWWWSVDKRVMGRSVLLFCLVFNGFIQSTAGTKACDDKDTKNHNIYCSGDILHQVMSNYLYNDSKTFVDLPLKYDPAVVLAKFNATFPDGRKQFDKAEKEKLKEFLAENFYPESVTVNLQDSVELLKCAPAGYKSNVKTINDLKGDLNKEFGKALNDKWKELCRQVKDEVRQNPQRFSLFPLKKPFIVPGGRFREIYYWDTLWTMRGLLVSEMHESVKDMLENMAELIEKFGFIPNGNRYYYSRRSQPPFFAMMVAEYNKYKPDDSQTIKDLAGSLHKELMFWENERQIDIAGQNTTMAQYRAKSTVPRPESYREDYDLAETSKPSDKKKFYQNIASAAESGWDFSSRWFADRMNMSTINTLNIVQIDLNSILCGAHKTFVKLMEKAGETQFNQQHEDLHKKYKKNIEELLLNKERNIYSDFNVHTKKHNNDFYPSSFMPWFTGCFKEGEHDDILKSTYDFMKSQRALDTGLGVPTSMINSGQQWDYPNGWPPLVHLTVLALKQSKLPEIQSAAVKIAQGWVQYNYDAFKNSSSLMFEKYEVTGKKLGGGSGGEYPVQDGFGWSNGVVLDFLKMFNGQLVVESEHRTTGKPQPTMEPIDLATTTLPRDLETWPEPEEYDGSQGLVFSTAALILTFIAILV